MDAFIRSILSEDPVWSAYALANLRPDFASFCQWTVAPDASGLVLVYTGLEPPILLTVGSTAGVTAALARTELPERVYLNIQERHLPIVQVHYPQIDQHTVLRMTLPAGTELPPSEQSSVPLTLADASRLKALYGCGGAFAPDAFATYQLADGYFFGVENRNGALTAAAGTHIVNRLEGVAAIGNVYTRPDCRRRGYGGAITTRIIEALQADTVGLIVLNVDSSNTVARSLYEKFGFVNHCSFVAGWAVKRDQWGPETCSCP